MPEQNITSEPVSEQLRAAEREVDAHYSQSVLMRLPFADACGYFLTVCEELSFLPLLNKKSENPNHELALADNMIQHAKAPIRWLKQACPAGGVVRQTYDEQMYEAAWDLSKLSLAYLSFEGAFSNATAGLLNLTLDGQRIKVSGPLRDDYRFEAYDRMLSPRMREFEVGTVDESFLRRFDASVRVRGDTFKYEINPRIVQAGLEALYPVIAPRFMLPNDWRFPEFSLAEFRQVASVLWTLAFMHVRGRLVAASQGCPGVGVSNALLVMEESEIHQRLRRYCRVSDSALSAIRKVLTYGGYGQFNPDPALQPIIPVTDSSVVISPSIVLNSSMERNFSVLLNRVPDARSAYTAQSQNREVAMKERLMDALEPMQVRFWSGTVPHWGTAGEIDLVVMQDSERQCLILELKSFIGPAEPREIRERSREIAKGIEQIQRRLAASDAHASSLHKVLKITPDYRLSWAVVSENSIGTPDIQQPGIPVVNAEHLAAKFGRTPSLAACARWLEAGDYLPKEGKDYQVHLIDETIGRWTLEWWALEPVIDDFITQD